MKDKQFKDKKVVMSKEEISRTLKRLAHEIVERNFGVRDLAIIGVQTRGVHLGKRIIEEAKKAGLTDGHEILFGTLDITLYRDDVDNLASHPVAQETVIPFDLNGKKIVIVDDVIYTGRSIRAAMDELMDFGRPQNIQLAVLVDRGARELPIEPNFTGKRFITSRDEMIAVELEEVDGVDQVVLRETK